MGEKFSFDSYDEIIGIKNMNVDNDSFCMAFSLDNRTDLEIFKWHFSFNESCKTHLFLKNKISGLEFEIDVDSELIIPKLVQQLVDEMLVMYTDDCIMRRCLELYREEIMRIIDIIALSRNSKFKLLYNEKLHLKQSRKFNCSKENFKVILLRRYTNSIENIEMLIL